MPYTVRHGDPDMMINVGSEARIVGTKKVNPQGNVAGLREFAGQEVLIVVPSKTPRYTPTPADVWTNARNRAVKNGQKVLAEFRTFRSRHLKTRVTGTDMLLEVAPATVKPTIRRADAWVRASALKLEKRAEQLLRN